MAKKKSPIPGNRGLNGKKFFKLDLKKYSGKCIGLVNGKIVVNEKNPSKAMERIMKISKNNEVALICVPSKKTTMAV